jgi:arylsulfatase
MAPAARLRVLLALPLLALTPPRVASGDAAPRAVGDRPNVVLLFPDQWRWDWTPDRIPGLRMPTFDLWSSAGARVESAFVPSPLCAPSRACLASGKEYDLAGVPDNFSNDYPVNQTTFYTILAEEAGYYTLTSGKDDLTKATGPGKDGSFHASELGWQGYARCEGKEDVVNKGVPSDPYGIYCAAHNTTVDGKSTSYWDIFADDDPHCCTGGSGTPGGYVCGKSSYMPQDGYEDNYVARNAAQLIASAPAGTPYFIHVSFPGPHPPFVVTGPMMNSTQGRTYPLAVNNRLMNETDQTTVRRDYAAEIENLDGLFASIIEAALARGGSDPQNTLFIFASDHGEMLGDNDDWGKEMPWQGSASVPLLFAPSSPALGAALGIAANASVVGLPVSTLDIAGTILDVAGAKPAANMTTVSLRPLLGPQPPDPQAYRPFVSSGLLTWRMVVQQRAREQPAPTGAAAHGAVVPAGATTIYKLICCNGACPGQPKPPSEKQGGYVDSEWARAWGRTAGTRRGAAAAAAAGAATTHLYDTLADPFDQNDLASHLPDVVAAMAPLLPSGWCGGKGR